MNNRKRVLYTLASGALVGLITGILFAPDKGTETRKKLHKLKQKLTCSGMDDDRKALEELSDVLEKELVIVNEKIEKLS